MDKQVIHNWLEGISSTDGQPPKWSDLERSNHSEAVDAISRFIADGGEHGVIAGHNVAHVYRCLLCVFNVHPLDKAEIVGWLQRWDGWSRSNDLTPILKWWFVALYAFCTGQPLPAAPPTIRDRVGTTPGKSAVTMTVLPGRAGHFLGRVVQKLRRKLSANPKHARSLARALTLRFLAKGTAKVSDETVAGSLEKHRKAITQVDGLRPTGAEDKSLLNRMLWQVRRTVFEIFGGKEFTHRERPLFPSRKGHHEVSGIKGGAATAVLETFAAHQNSRNVGLAIHPLRNEPMIPVIEYSQEAFASAILAGVRREVYGSIIYGVDGIRRSNPMLATPVAVTEPCKTRIVTKGPEFTYYYLKDLQKFMWKVLKDHPCFELIGKPISEEVLMKRFGNLPLGISFVSGDYSAATDNLRSKLSRAAARALSSAMGLSQLDSDVLEAALVGHTLVYKKEQDGKKFTVVARQTNGQLMGSPASFPVLCLVNAAICRYALETSGSFEYQEGSDDHWGDLADETDLLTLRQAPLLVNGDDCVFAIDCPFRFNLWERMAARCGMESSVGKTYVSSDFIQMNSATFTVHEFVDPTDRRESVGLVFKEVPYLNFGFLSPFDPKGGRERTYRDLPALAADFLRGHTGKLRDAMMGWFLKSHRRLLETIPEGMSYWLPVHLGGLGLPITRKLSEADFSDMQLNFAAFLLQTLKEPTTFPAEEKTVPVWVRSGERLASSLRRREKVDLDTDPWEDDRTVKEDEQFLYWCQSGCASPEAQVIVPASRGNWKRLFAQFSKRGPRGSNSRPPLATLLGDPSPAMVLVPGVCELFEARGTHPQDLYSRISSLVEARPYLPRDRKLGRVQISGGVIFELFENHFCIRKNPFCLDPSDPERRVGLRCLLASECESVASDTNVHVRTPVLAQSD